MTGLALTRSFSFSFSIPLSFHLLFLGPKAFRGSDGLSPVKIRLGNGVIVSCVAILLTLHASSHTFCWLFFLDAPTICLLISVDLAAPYHFHIQCKCLHFVVGFWCFELYLIFSVGSILVVICCRFSF